MANKWWLRLFEEPRDVGCVGVIIVIVLIALCSTRQCSGNDNRVGKRIQPDIVVETTTELKSKCAVEKIIKFFPTETKTTLSKRRTANERFGATAAGRADLKCSAGMPPLRQAAIPLCVSGGRVIDKVVRLENGVQPDNKNEQKNKKNAKKLL